MNQIPLDVLISSAALNTSELLLNSGVKTPEVTTFVRKVRIPQINLVKNRKCYSSGENIYTYEV